jgi:hypothetical protein
VSRGGLAVDVVGAPVDVFGARRRVIVGPDKQAGLRQDHGGG